jgi:hypothetical protein
MAQVPARAHKFILYIEPERDMPNGSRQMPNEELGRIWLENIFQALLQPIGALARHDLNSDDPVFHFIPRDKYIFMGPAL